MREVSRFRLSESIVQATTAYTRKEVYDEIVWLLAEDGTDDILIRAWQLVRPNASVLVDPAGGKERFLLEQKLIDPVGFTS